MLAILKPKRAPKVLHGHQLRQDLLDAHETS